ncbi:non-specific serine/threonine protein kinase [Trifolium repens]|nr:non-specific serine/threonine protein kinase [Trifolium repens]
MFPTFAFCLSLLFAFNFIQNTNTSSLGNKTDNLALLKFKESISNDPYGILASWNTSTHYWEIPTNLSSCSDLEVLFLSSNHLIGKIPTGINSLRKLQMLQISNNNLTGRIPPFIGNLSSLVLLHMTKNHLEGDIPQEICSLKHLTTIAVSQNRIYGTFPSCLYNMSSLTAISVAANEFNGPLPPNMFNTLSNLQEFLIGGNQFSGTIPISIGNASVLQALDLSRNNLVGQVPSLGKLHDIQWISLEFNNLGNAFNGTIPTSLGSLKGEVPTYGVFGNVSRLAVTGNNKLCGGSFGSVYKGNLASEGKVVAIKVLNLKKKGAQKSYIAEYYKGQEFKALVFEYMSNGSIEQWLHPETVNAGNQRMLDLDQRFNIIVDIASVLHYLHHDCEQTIIHCDLKPSNVLLDDDMVARVSDFGIARLVSVVDDTSHQETSTLGIKGTIGYAPPEYGMGSQISTYGDMYSFGVLLLEMLTGRRPADEMFEDGQNLHMFVENSFPNNLIQILDPHLLPRNEEATIEDGNIGSFTPISEKCLVSLFRIGLACSVESPKDRMNIVDVTRELSLIKKAFLAGEID